MNAILTSLFIVVAINGVSGYVPCGGKRNFQLSPRIWICCGSKIQFKSRRQVTCCINKAYNPMAQECCGGVVYAKRSINSGCCNGKFYQRGVQNCCGKELIDIKTEGCCRNVKFNRKYESCCDGERVPNLFFDETVKPTCCGKKLIDSGKYTCCAENEVPLVGGNNTKCCRSFPYDSSRDICCNGRIEPNLYSTNKECCGNDLIDQRYQYCCAEDPYDRVYRNMGCCRIGPQRYKVFDADKSICCAGEIEPKTGNTVSCCGKVAYDVKTHICCEMKVLPRTRTGVERCCGTKVYNRQTNICCAGMLWPLPPFMEKYMFCCGRIRYDRRSFRCLRGNRLASLNIEKEKV